MTTTLYPPPPPPSLILHRRHLPTTIRCSNINGGDNIKKSTVKDSVPQNIILKTAWYTSELLGITASLFRTPAKPNNNNNTKTIFKVDQHGLVDRQLIVETIQHDFQNSYFVTGGVTVDAYEDDCEFADPAGSFKGLARFKRNCTNFGYLVQKSNMKLTKWEDFEDKGIGHWRFSCTMAFPWKPILSATGYTEYYLSKESGKVCRHVEHWNVPKMALFKQLLRPSRV